MRALVIAIVVGVLGAHGAPALADRELCGRAHRAHGKPIDLDVKAADLHDVFRWLADTNGFNVVVSDDITGKLTLQLRHVAWEDIACAVAAMHHLHVTVDGTIVIVRAR